MLVVPVISTSSNHFFHPTVCIATGQTSSHVMSVDLLSFHGCVKLLTAASFCFLVFLEMFLVVFAKVEYILFENNDILHCYLMVCSDAVVSRCKLMTIAL